MTKKKNWVLFSFVGLGLIFFMKKDTPASLSENKLPRTPTLAINSNPVSKIIDHHKKPLDRVPASVGYVNTPSPDWEKRLETSLKEQSGNSLKTIKIQKESSMVWVKDGNPLLVQSVIITLTSQKAAESSFRAMVDSQTGKVLESWDRTISDPANVRGGFRIKLDPRYSN